MCYVNLSPFNWSVCSIFKEEEALGVEHQLGERLRAALHVHHNS